MRGAKERVGMSVKKRSGVKGGERTCEKVKGKMKERETCTNY